MHPSKILASSLLLVLALSGCTKADKSPDGINGPSGGEGTATFRIKSLDGKGNVVADDRNDPAMIRVWRVPQKASFQLTACIEDRASKKDATKHRFEVEDPSNGHRFADVKPTATDGCFSWREPIYFNYFVKRSSWVVIERDIVGTGVHTGRQRVRFALNPWATKDVDRDSGDDFYFLRSKTLDPSMVSAYGEARGFADESVLKQDTLYVEDVSIQNIRRGERDTGMMMRMNIAMEPKVLFENNAGVPARKKLADGEFYIIAHLVLNNSGPGMNERVILTSSAKEAVQVTGLNDGDTPGVVGQGKVIDGKLLARLDVWVDPRLPQGNLELALKLVPRGVRGLGSFEGIYELGSLRNLSSHFSGALSESCREKGPCKIAPYLSSAANFKDLHDKGYATNNSPYLFDRLKLRFVQVQPGETTTRRTVAYSASTCVIDAFTGERPIGLPFTIRYKSIGKDKDGNDVSGEVIENKPTEEDGCLNWSSTISHKYYDPEEFVEQLVSIEKASGVKRELRFYINPWDDKFTFGFDEREFKPEFWAEQKKRRKIKSRFFLGDFGYHTVRFQYNIDSLMSLEVRKTVLMELNPRVLRYSGIINARKMTEPLRDGIWLLKVAIQKNYLDPAQKGVTIDTLRESQAMVRLANETPNPKDQERRSANRLRKLGISAPSKEFISTQTTLVRSTDGMIIQPVELNMQDLRMMRVRSNFLVQLEAVNESKLQTHNVLMSKYAETIDGILADRRRRNADLGKEDPKKIDPTVEQQKIWDTEDKKNKDLVDSRRGLIRNLFDEIASQLDLEHKGEVRMDDFKLDERARDFLKPLLDKLNLELQANDFTNIKLPSCVDMNCNEFLEPQSGLDRRTFVGPVIFLSNGYKDSVRATDNLDEAQCGQQVDFDDVYEKDMKMKERELFRDDNAKVAKERQNTIYKFSEYFGSLRHLCYKHVDDLIKREAEDKYVEEANIPVASSVYNYSEAYNLDFLSLGDQEEMPRRVDMSPDSLRRCDGNLVKCMRPTEDHRLSQQRALEWINGNVVHSKSYLERLKIWKANREWKLSDVREALFGEGKSSDKRYATCALVTANLLQTMRLNDRQPWGTTVERLQDDIMDSCMKNDMDPVVFDRKLRVFKAGEDGDSYVFLGGYQMNINVGESFSVGRSNSLSWGWSVEATDVLSGVNGMLGLKGPAISTSGGLTGAVTGIGPGFVGKLASAIKPLSVKLNGSSSLGDSEGTSISKSTYLVAQIAKFRVRLDEFERCVILSFSPQFQKVLRLQGRFVWDEKANGPIHPVFACEGTRNNKPRFVDETYFYFTQHFTEGDMLDQADLYNHPWLLALRGYRDFGAFLTMINAQEAVNLTNFGTGVLWPKPRSLDWPLAHMKEVYRQVTPSFPGFYTELDTTESGTEFPLERRNCNGQDPKSGCDPYLKVTDPDINQEVFTRPKADPRRQ